MKPYLAHSQDFFSQVVNTFELCAVVNSQSILLFIRKPTTTKVIFSREMTSQKIIFALSWLA